MSQTAEAADRTEALLQELIAECGAIIRTQLRPAIDAASEPHHKWNYAEAAVGLVKIAARAGEAVARLRGGSGAQSQHRIIVERLAPEKAKKGKGGGGR